MTMNKLLGISLAIILISTMSISNEIFAENEIPELLSNPVDIEITDEMPGVIILQKVDVNFDAFNHNEFSVTIFDETFTLTNITDDRDKDNNYWRGQMSESWRSLTSNNWEDDSDYKENIRFKVNDEGYFGVIFVNPLVRIVFDLTFENPTVKILKISGDDAVYIPGPNDGMNIVNESMSVESQQNFFASSASIDDSSNYGNRVPKEVQTLADSYIGGNDYGDNYKVTIDVVVGYTEEAENNKRDLRNLIKSRIDETNASFNGNHLPIEIRLVDTVEVKRYTQTSVADDYTDLLYQNEKALERLLAVGVKENADIVMLITHYDNPDIFESCGRAYIFPIVASDSVGIVQDECMERYYYSFTHEIGHIFGAHHNPEVEDSNGNPTINVNFAFGYGFYNRASDVSTIMSYGCPDEKISDPCYRQLVWSDPYDTFSRGAVAGTEDNYNAKVLFGTAPFVASLRGEIVTYDNVKPTGFFEWLGEFIGQVFSAGDKMNISASFDESIHDDYPPYVTVSDNVISTTSEMNKVSDTNYKYSHQLTSEIGDITLSFSNARDLFANEIVSEPTSGGSITVVAPDIEPPIIILTPPTTITLEIPTPYSELGYLAIDNVDRDITDKVIVTGTVDHTTLGTYTLYYDVSDTAGNNAITATRTVSVVDTTEPTITAPSDYTTETLTKDNTPLDASHYGTPIVTDNSGKIITPTSDAPDTFPIGETTITWSATDSSGNTATATQIITIQYTHITIPYDIANSKLTHTANIQSTFAPDAKFFDMTFDASDTQLYVLAKNGVINQYTCAESSVLSSCDISTPIDSHTIKDMGIPTRVTSMEFSPDGNHLTLGGAGMIYDVDCSTSFAISTCNLQSDNYIPITLDRTHDLAALTYSNDGYKIFALSYSDAYTLTCTIPYVSSSCTVLGDDEEFNMIHTYDYEASIEFNPEGTQLFTSKELSGIIDVYYCSTGFVMSTCSLTDNYYSIDVGEIEVDVGGFTFSSDGEIFSFVGWASGNVYEFEN